MRPSIGDQIKNYFKNNYILEASSGAAMALTGSTVLFGTIQMTAPNAAAAVSNFFQTLILNRIFTVDYATLGFPLLNFFIGITALVLLGNCVDTFTEKTCKLVSRLQNKHYLPKPGDERVFLFLLPYTYYPTLPFSASQAKLFIAAQLILQTGNAALQLSSNTKDHHFSQALKTAYNNPVFCALMPMMAKMIFLGVGFILYFGQMAWRNGINAAISAVHDFPNKCRFMWDYACLKHLSAEQLVFNPALPNP